MVTERRAWRWENTHSRLIYRVTSWTVLYHQVSGYRRCSECFVRWARSRGGRRRADTGACCWKLCRTPSTSLPRTSSCRRTTSNSVKVGAPLDVGFSFHYHVAQKTGSDSFSQHSNGVFPSSELGALKDTLAVRGDPAAGLGRQQQWMDDGKITVLNIETITRWNWFSWTHFIWTSTLFLA